jgi:DNA-damage-inducible protein J
MEMNKTETIRARITPSLKGDAEAILGALGLSATEAITLFYRQVVLQEGLPFEVRLPNKETVRAMRAVRARKGLKETSVRALKKEFGIA